MRLTLDVLANRCPESFRHGDRLHSQMQRPAEVRLHKKTAIPTGALGRIRASRQSRPCVSEFLYTKQAETLSTATSMFRCCCLASPGSTRPDQQENQLEGTRRRGLVQRKSLERNSTGGGLKAGCFHAKGFSSGALVCVRLGDNRNSSACRSNPDTLSYFMLFWARLCFFFFRPASFWLGLPVTGHAPTCPEQEQPPAANHFLQGYYRHNNTVSRVRLPNRATWSILMRLGAWMANSLAKSHRFAQHSLRSVVLVALSQCRRSGNQNQPRERFRPLPSIRLKLPTDKTRGMLCMFFFVGGHDFLPDGRHADLFTMQGDAVGTVPGLGLRITSRGALLAGNDLPGLNHALGWSFATTGSTFPMARDHTDTGP